MLLRAARRERMAAACQHNFGLIRRPSRVRDWLLVALPDDNQLSAQLAESSAAFARSALQAQHDDHRVFLLHAATALEENVEGARLRVETALAIARREFERRFGALDDPTREAMLRVIEAGYAPEKYDEQLLDCPACDTPALVLGSVKVEMDEDWDH